MYVIIWAFQVPGEHTAAFEAAYGSDGDWAALFRCGVGYLGTELLRDTSQPGRYLTIDRWSSVADYETFRRLWHDEYQALDRRFEALTAREAPLGSFESPVA